MIKTVNENLKTKNIVLLRNNLEISLTSKEINKDVIIIIKLSVEKLKLGEKYNNILLSLFFNGQDSNVKFKAYELKTIPTLTNSAILNSLNKTNLIKTFNKTKVGMQEVILDIANLVFEEKEDRLETNIILINNHNISSNSTDLELLGSKVVLKVNNVCGLNSNKGLLSFQNTKNMTSYINVITGELITLRNVNDGINDYNLIARVDKVNDYQGRYIPFVFNTKYDIENESLLDETYLSEESSDIILTDYTNTEHYFKFFKRENDINIFKNSSGSIFYKIVGTNGVKYHLESSYKDKIIFEKQDGRLYIREVDKNLNKATYEYINDDLASISSNDYNMSFGFAENDGQGPGMLDISKYEVSFSKTDRKIYYDISTSTTSFAYSSTIEKEEENYVFDGKIYHITDKENNFITSIDYLQDKVVYISQYTVTDTDEIDHTYTHLLFNYYPTYTEVTDVINKKKYYYYFDSKGNVKDIVEDKLKISSYYYEKDNIVKSISMPVEPKEPVQNGSFEEDFLGWHASEEVSIDMGLLSNKCAVLVPDTFITQSIDLKGNVKYKIEGMVKFADPNENTDSYVVIECGYYTHLGPNDQLLYEGVFKVINVVVQLNGNASGWRCFSSEEFSLPVDAYDVVATLSVYASDEFYIDEITLSGRNNKPINLVQNGDLEIKQNNLPVNFTFENLDTNDKIIDGINDYYHDLLKNKRVFSIQGIDYFQPKVKKIKQTVNVIGKTNDIFSVGLLLRGEILEKEKAKLYVKINYTMGEKTYYFTPTLNLKEYQKIFGSFVSEGKFTSLEIGFEYSGSKDIVIDGFELYKGVSTTEKTYNEDNELNTLGTIDNKLNIKYDDKQRVEKLLTSDGEEVTYIYDVNDNITQTDIYGNSVITIYDTKLRPIYKIYKHLNENDVLEEYEESVVFTDNSLITKKDIYDKSTIQNKNEIGLLKQITYPNNLIIEYEYNSMDELKFIHSKNNNLSYGFNKFVKKTDKECAYISNISPYPKNDNPQIDFIYSEAHHDEEGSVLNGNYPSTYIQYKYDDHDNVVEIKNNFGLVETYEYDENDIHKVTRKKCYYENNESTSALLPPLIYDYTYDNLNRLSKIQMTDGDNVIENITIFYDAYSNIYAIDKEKEDKTEYYQYDNNGNVKKCIESSGSFIEYTYDQNGNIENKTSTNMNQYNSITYDNLSNGRCQNQLTYLNKLSKLYSSDYIIGNNYQTGINGLQAEQEEITYVYDSQMNANVINLTNNKHLTYYLPTTNSQRTGLDENSEEFDLTAWQNKFLYNKTINIWVKPMNVFERSYILNLTNATNDDISLMTNEYGHLNLKHNNTSLLETTNSLMLDKWNMITLTIVSSENDEVFTYYVGVNGDVEKATISTSTFETDTMIIGKRYIENNNGSLVQTPITRQMPLRIKLISLDAFEHTERTITNMYLDGVKALTIPTKTKKQSLFLEVNNNKYQYTKEVNTTGKLVAQKVYKNDNIIITTQYQYDKVRPIKETINNFETNYTYDDMGNITSKINSERINIYTYDSLGRLLTHNNGTNTRTYEYDFEGNIKRVIETQDNTLNVNNTIVYDYTYSANKDNRLLSITRKRGQNSPVTTNTLTYDGSSSSYPSKINGVSLTWNKGKLTSYGNNTYEYNLLGQRTKKTTQTHIHEYTYDDTLLVKEKITNKSNNQVVVLEYIYDQQNILIGVAENYNVYYYDRDITGEIRGLIDTNGNYVIKYYYTVFGEVTKEPILQNNIINFNSFLYKGYYYDEETQLYWVSSRYYSPELCRWISPDSIEYLDPESINGLNLYAYCGNDPVNKYDPSGHFAITTFLICLGVGALVGGTLGGITAYSEGQDILTGVLTGALLGAAVGAVVGIGGAALSGAVSSVLGKTATDLISVAFYGGEFGSWEDYAIAFAFGGLTGSLGSVTGKFAGLAKAGKFAADVALRPAANQLVKMGTRGNTFNRDKYLYDVITRTVTYGGSNSIMKSNMFGLNLKVDLGKCFYRSTFRSLYSYI